MKFSCDKCSVQYMISDDKVGPNGVRVRCKRCGNIVSVKRAPLVAPEIDSDPGVSASNEPEEAYEQSAAIESSDETAAEISSETSLELELGQAFEHAFGEATSAPTALPAPEAEAEAESEPQQSEERSEEPPAPIGLPPPEAPPPADASSAEAIEEWYVAIEDNQVGPLQATLVKARWEAGEIGPDTLAWRPGMGDWMPLSSIPEMAQYLAPVPRPAAAPAPAPAPAPSFEEGPRSLFVNAPPAAATPSSVNGTVADHGEELFKPSAASTLAALASQEISSYARPEPALASPASAGLGALSAGSLVDRMGLPDGGVDPTNIVPLPIKGLEQTGESDLKSKPSAPGARSRGGPSRLVVISAAGAAVLLVAVGVVIAVSFMRPSAPAATASSAPAAERSASAPQVNAATRPAPAAAAAAPAAAAPQAASQAAAPASAQVPPQRAAPETAARAPQAEARPAAKESEPPPGRAMSRRERAAKAAKEAAERKAKLARERVAVAAPPPPPAQAPAEQPHKRATDPLLDVGDDDVDAELGGRAAKNKRSVYVPPAIGGDLPQQVSIAQINEAVRGRTSALEHCVQQQKSSDPNSRGTLRIRWIIGSDGGVRDVRVLSDELSRQPIGTCISSVVRGLRFPRSRTTGQEVVFPFKF